MCRSIASVHTAGTGCRGTISEASTEPDATPLAQNDRDGPQWPQPLSDPIAIVLFQPSANVFATALVTGATPGIGEGLSGNRDELPVVAVRVQRQLERTKGTVVENLTVRDRRSRTVDAPASCTNHELAHTCRLIQPAASVLGREPLVHVLMPRQEQLHPMVGQQLEGAVQPRVAAMRRPA